MGFRAREFESYGICRALAFREQGFRVKASRFGGLLV